MNDSLTLRRGHGGRIYHLSDDGGQEPALCGYTPRFGWVGYGLHHPPDGRAACGNCKLVALIHQAGREGISL